MNVGELKSIIKDIPDDYPVLVSKDGGISKPFSDCTVERVVDPKDEDGSFVWVRPNE